MAFNPQTVTPGSAVAQTIQEILARRRAEEQQTFLNRLQISEAEETKRSRAEQERQAREQEARMQSVAAAQIEQAKQATLGQRISRLAPGTLPENIKDEAYREQLIQENIFPSLQPQGPTETGEPIPPILSAYPGTMEYQERERSRNIFSEAAEIAAMPEGPEKTSALQELAIRGAGEGIPQFVQQIYAKPEFVYNANTGRFIQTPTGGSLGGIIQPRTIPAVTAASMPKWKQIFDEQENLVTSVLGDKAAIEFLAQNPGKRLFVRDEDYQPRAGAVPKMTDSFRVNLARARAAAKAEREENDRWFTTDSNKAKEALSSMTASYVYHPVYEDVPELAKRIAVSILSSTSNKLDTVPVQVIVKGLQDTGLLDKSVNITPELIEAIERLVSPIKGMSQMVGAIPVSE